MKKDIKQKEYSLSKDEKEHLESCRNLRTQYEYLANLIARDMHLYVYTTVRRRLGLGDDVVLSYDIDAGKLITTPRPEPVGDKEQNTSEEKQVN